MTIGDHSRIDNFYVVSGCVNIGKNVHVAIFCNVAGGSEGVILDDYSCRTMTNPTVPSEYKNEKKDRVEIGRHCILGTC